MDYMNDEQIRQEIHAEAQKRADEHVARIRLIRFITLFLWPGLSLLMFMLGSQAGWLGFVAFVLIGLLIVTIADGLIYALILGISPFIYFAPMKVFDLAFGKNSMAAGVPRNLVNSTAFLLYLAYVMAVCYVSYTLIF